MKNKPHILKWRNRIEELTPADHRIGTDILLIDDADVVRAEKFIGNIPFKMDMSMAIIYNRGTAVTKINMKKYEIHAPAVVITMPGQTIEPISCSDDLDSRAIVMSSSFTENLFPGSSDVQAHTLYSSVLSNPVINFKNDQYAFGQYYDLLLNIARSPNSEFRIEAAKHLTLAMFYGYSHMRHNISTPSKGSTRQEDIYSAL